MPKIYDAEMAKKSKREQKTTSFNQGQMSKCPKRQNAPNPKSQQIPNSVEFTCTVDTVGETNCLLLVRQLSNLFLTIALRL